MNSILKKFIGSNKTVDYSSVMVVYKTPEGNWRGFVVPFDITYEAKSKKEVQVVLKDMIASYVEALSMYNNPQHLAEVPLSDKDDDRFEDSFDDEYSYTRKLKQL
jgi:hypothetical protein